MSSEPTAKRTASDAAIQGEIQKMAKAAKILAERNVKELALTSLAQKRGGTGDGIDPTDGGLNPGEAGRSPEEYPENTAGDLHSLVKLHNSR